MDLKIHKTAHEATIHLATIIAEQIQEKPDSVIGFATGRTMNSVYFHLVSEFGKSLDCSKVQAFIIDEYIGLKESSKYSYKYYMENNLYDHMNFKRSNLHFPKVESENLDLACSDYESELLDLGGLDLLLLGIGANGHIALNEPGSGQDSRTRIVALTQQTMNSNGTVFKNESTPQTAISLGIGTLLESKKICLLATGASKASIVEKVMKTKSSSIMPATYLHEHEDILIILDEESSKFLD